ncbi:MAG: ribosomal protein S18-alanine N-acetyltransferase [Pseudomonadota bacterium]
MKLAVGLFALDSIKEAVQIHQQCLPMPWSEDVFHETLKDPTHIGFKGIVDDTLVGFIMGRRVDLESEILTLVVHKDWQKKGIGAKLLNLFLNYLQHEGVCRVLLEVQASNTPALELYRVFGFKKIGERANYYPVAAGYSRTADVLQKTFF